MEKEKAYLRILSKEWKKRDADRAKQIGEKARQLQLREAEIHEQAEKLAKKEEELKEQEAEVRPQNHFKFKMLNRLLILI